MPLDPQAQQLNDAIAASHPQVLDMLSKRGKAIYFPKLGVLMQSAEAQGKDINATVGIALEEDGSPLVLPSLADAIKLPKGNAFTYAPSPGRPDLRKLWKEMILKKSPSLAGNPGKPISLPVVTAALTHGISMAAYLFCDENDTVYIPDLYWENYDLAVTLATGAKLETFNTFTPAGGFDVAALKAKLSSGNDGKRGGKKIVSLNFPNNPSGYTPTVGEAAEIVKVLTEAAAAGDKVVVLLDDAYFGLVFEKGVYEESVFAPLADAHPNLLAVKIDGATKEDYVWGFRVGFLTYGIQGGTASLYDALEAKTGGAIRGNISNSSHPAQSLLLGAWSAPGYAAEKKKAYDLLKQRYDKVREILAAHPEYAEAFTALPFNSGYFMCVRPVKADAEALRRKLLADYSTGTVNFGGILRVAFSATPTEKIGKLFGNIYEAAQFLG
jgi:aspartate/methionine/tyrosine aminotransferase